MNINTGQQSTSSKLIAQSAVLASKLSTPWPHFGRAWLGYCASCKNSPSELHGRQGRLLFHSKQPCTNQVAARVAPQTSVSESNMVEASSLTVVLLPADESRFLSEARGATSSRSGPPQPAALGQLQFLAIFPLKSRHASLSLCAACGAAIPVKKSQVTYVAGLTVIAARLACRKPCSA